MKVFISMFIFSLIVACSEDREEKNGGGSGSSSKEEVVRHVMENDEGIVKGMPERKKPNEISHKKLEDLPMFSQSMEAFKKFCLEMDYEVIPFDKLVGKFPYLSGYESLVYDSYTIKREGKSVLILWHLNGFEDLEQAHHFIKSTLDLYESKDPAFKKHYKRFKYWAITEPNDVLLFQASESLYDTDPNLNDNIFNQFQAERYIPFE